MARARYQDWITEEGLLKIEGWARDGLTEERIAEKMGVSRKTLFNWKKQHLPILHALKRGKEVIDRQVENALLKRALGYKYDEVTKEMVEDGTGRMAVTKIVTKEVHPDTTAQIFWLKNRKPNEWRDKKETELSGGLELNNPYEGLTTEELRKIARSEKDG